jgi:hypothetical protein
LTIALGEAVPVAGASVGGDVEGGVKAGLDELASGVEGVTAGTAGVGDPLGIGTGRKIGVETSRLGEGGKGIGARSSARMGTTTTTHPKAASRVVRQIGKKLLLRNMKIVLGEMLVGPLLVNHHDNGHGHIGGRRFWKAKSG